MLTQQPKLRLNLIPTNDSEDVTDDISLKNIGNGSEGDSPYFPSVTSARQYSFENIKGFGNTSTKKVDTAILAFND